MPAPPGTAEPAAGSTDRFGLVFLLLISIFVLDALFTSPRAQAAILLVYVAVLLLVLRAVSIRRGVAPLLRIAVAGGSLVVFAVAWGLPGGHTAGALALWLSALLLATIAVIVRRLLHHRAVTLQTIYGALSAYLLIGFLFAALYSAVAHLGPGKFFAGGEQPTSASLQYFSFITMTTTGYGDLTPFGNGPRSLAVLEALLGQIFLVTLVARLVAMFGQLRPERRSDPVEADGPQSRSDGL
ncbi:MAG: potassium channel family protein [Catenulispora sp.]